MRVRLPFSCSFVLAVSLLAGAAAAQTAKPAREPDVPYVPTTETAVQEMLKLADVKKGDVVYDLGCGDGRIVIAAAKNFGARGVGIDINPERIRGRERTRSSRVSSTWSASRRTICSRPSSAKRAS
jgi:SAM-dependent methyltransferase